MIEIKKLHKHYKKHIPHYSLKNFVLNFFKNKRYQKALSSPKRSVISDLNVVIQSTEIVGIYGANGVGKSTLGKLIAGTIEPSSGSIKAHGKIVPFLELGVAFNPELSGIDNLYLNGSLLGLSWGFLKKNKGKIFEFAGIQEFMQMPLKYYSTGMQLRLAFSIAMHAQGDIYIFDEILAVGDENFQKKCMASFEKLMKDSKTIIIISHDLGFLLEHASHLLYLEQDRFFYLDKKKELHNIHTREALEAYCATRVS